MKVTWSGDGNHGEFSCRSGHLTMTRLEKESGMKDEVFKWDEGVEHVFRTEVSHVPKTL